MYKLIEYEIEQIKNRYLKKGTKLKICQRGFRYFLQTMFYEENVKLLSDIYYAWIKKYEKNPYKSKALKIRSKLAVVVLIPEDENLNECTQRSLELQNFKKFSIYYSKPDIVSIINNVESDYIVFLKNNDTLAPNALYELVKIVKNSSEEYAFIYSDEDLLDRSGKRIKPYFKPDWSPDKFMCWMYTGNLVAVNSKILKDISLLTNEEFYYQLYDALLKVEEKNCKISHISSILYHNRGEIYKGRDINIEIKIKEEALIRRGYAGRVIYNTDKRLCRVLYNINSTPLISIIIPSKDNYSILYRCISSILNTSHYKNYEIIVVDNGSNTINKEKITKLLQLKGFKYIYKNMNFNFSKMCNLGANAAKGEYLLFLNDDIEIIQKDWIDLLLGHASLKHVGAVGAKLLYPYSKIIQHIGTCNLEVGPVHILTLFNDNISYYFNQNRTENNYIAVTAACMMIEKIKFQKVGGFDEELKIGYNDVSLGMSLYERGYYNVVRNDVILYHHESLSRGDDNLSKEKFERLYDERMCLYQKHPSIGKKDPFYNKNLVGCKANFDPNIIYKFECHDLPSKTKYLREIDRKYINDCIKLNLDNVILYSDMIYLEGWAFASGSDNAKYKMKIILQDEKQLTNIICFSTFPRYRDDVSGQFPNEINIELSGFVCHIPYHYLKNKSYKVYILLEARFSREKLIKKFDYVLNSNSIKRPNILNIKQKEKL